LPLKLRIKVAILSNVVVQLLKEVNHVRQYSSVIS